MHPVFTTTLALVCLAGFAGDYTSNSCAPASCATEPVRRRPRLFLVRRLLTRAYRKCSPLPATTSSTSYIRIRSLLSAPCHRDMTELHETAVAHSDKDNTQHLRLAPALRDIASFSSSGPGTDSCGFCSCRAPASARLDRAQRSALLQISPAACSTWDGLHAAPELVRLCFAGDCAPCGSGLVPSRD